MSVKAEKTMTMDAFIERILPFTTWAPYDILKEAKNCAVVENRDWQCIVRDIVFIVPKDDVLRYLKEHGDDKTFAVETNEFESAFSAAVEGKTYKAPESSQRRPGRPRKAFPGEPLPEELK